MLKGSLITLMLMCYLANPAFAEPQSGCGPQVAQLVSAQGWVDTQRASHLAWQPARLEERYCADDSVRTGSQSRAVVAFLEGLATNLALDQETLVKFLSRAGRIVLSVDLGQVHVRSHTPRHFDVTTPFVNAGIEGTEFLVATTADQAEVTVFEGSVRVSNPQGSLLIQKGQTALARRGRAPEIKLPIRPDDAVQWALYYPPIIDVAALSRTTRSIPLRRALHAYLSGRISDALVTLDQIPVAERASGAYLQAKAGLLLSVGRVDEAEPLLRRRLHEKPDDPDSLALQAVIALSRNQPDAALALARRAVDLGPQAPVPWLALSYIEQAQFRLDAALKAVAAALRLDPENGLAHARQAELLTAVGELATAHQAAEKSALLTPQLARPQVVLGFIQLLQSDTDEARRSFGHAITRDSYDPLAHFGLGLAQIRDGQLKEGTAELEIAGSLDPHDALIRSYLGKAYYEQKRSSIAQAQFDLAKQFDPKDPTPYFYDALRKQSDNRPVEALADLQRAQALNDNRAVYRSRQLLDDDRAVRGTSLARIYDTLGFDQRAIVEASQSLALDPANPAAHRFLSDVSLQLPRREVAQLSELLQAQLLQPININPVQPHLTMANRNMLMGMGLVDTAFRDFTRVYERNRPQLTIAGVGGTMDTGGDEVVISGIQDRFSYSFGQFHYQTDGWRKNADLTHDVYNAFIQSEITDALNVQFEYRHRETRQGFLFQSLDPCAAVNSEFLSAARWHARCPDSDQQPSRERHKLNEQVFRGGIHLKLSANSDLIGSVASLDSFTRRTDPNGPPFKQEDQWDGLVGELQYLWRNETANLVAGTAGYGADHRSGESELDSRPALKRAPGTDALNGYVYLNRKLPLGAVGTAGLALDYYHSQGQGTLAQWHPKVGLQWDINDAVRLRFAYLEGLKPQQIFSQTLQPTQVAGFNQFYDDYDGKPYVLYGAGLDLHRRNTLFGGAEFLRRDIYALAKVGHPFRQEDYYKAYLNWAPSERLAISAGYRLELDHSFESDSSDYITQTVPVSLRYFAPEGVFWQLGANFVWQRKIATSQSEDLSDRFVVYNTALGYRLPKRSGIISIEVRNLFDTRFRYENFFNRDNNIFNNTQEFTPGRTVLAQVLLNF